MTRTLALDLGTACGWALHDPKMLRAEGIKPDQDVEAYYAAPAMQYGTFDLRAGQHSGGGMRYLKFRRELARFADVDEVVYELVRRHVGTAAAHVYGGLLGILTAWCEENKIPYEGLTVQAIKKFATGKGNGDKAAVIKAVEGWGFQPKNDNEADAIALLRLRLSETKPRDPVVPLPAGRREVAGGAQLRAACR